MVDNIEPQPDAQTSSDTDTDQDPLSSYQLSSQELSQELKADLNLVQASCFTQFIEALYLDLVNVYDSPLLKYSGVASALMSSNRYQYRQQFAKQKGVLVGLACEAYDIFKEIKQSPRSQETDSANSATKLRISRHLQELLDYIDQAEKLIIDLLQHSKSLTLKNAPKPARLQDQMGEDSQQSAIQAMEASVDVPIEIIKQQARYQKALASLILNETLPISVVRLNECLLPFINSEIKQTVSLSHSGACIIARPNELQAIIAACYCLANELNLGIFQKFCEMTTADQDFVAALNREDFLESNQIGELISELEDFGTVAVEVTVDENACITFCCETHNIFDYPELFENSLTTACKKLILELGNRNSIETNIEYSDNKLLITLTPTDITNNNRGCFYDVIETIKASKHISALCEEQREFVTGADDLIAVQKDDRTVLIDQENLDDENIPQEYREYFRRMVQANKDDIRHCMPIWITRTIDNRQYTVVLPSGMFQSPSARKHLVSLLNRIDQVMQTLPYFNLCQVDKDPNFDAKNDSDETSPTLLKRGSSALSNKEALDLGIFNHIRFAVNQEHHSTIDEEDIIGFISVNYNRTLANKDLAWIDDQYRTIKDDCEHDSAITLTHQEFNNQEIIDLVKKIGNLIRIENLFISDQSVNRHMGDTLEESFSYVDILKLTLKALEELDSETDLSQLRLMVAPGNIAHFEIEEASLATAYYFQLRNYNNQSVVKGKLDLDQKEFKYVHIDQNLVEQVAEEIVEMSAALDLEQRDRALIKQVDDYLSSKGINVKTDFLILGITSSCRDRRRGTRLAMEYFLGKPDVFIKADKSGELEVTSSWD